MSTLKGIATRSEKKIIENLYQEKNVKKFLKDFELFHLKYLAAMKEVETKIHVLNEDFSVRYNHSPIERIESRIKTPESLMKKMMRNKINFDINNIENNIFDIAGVRIVCSFISDIYTIIHMIKMNDEIEIVREKDYINHPKESGYRSYHMIVKIPVFLTTGKENVIVEVQIRTMAMDFWASLEHKIKYKYDGIIPDDVKKELVGCSNAICNADEQMMVLNEKVKNANL